MSFPSVTSPVEISRARPEARSSSPLGGLHLLRNPLANSAMDEYIFPHVPSFGADRLASVITVSPAQRPTGTVPEGQPAKAGRTLSRALLLRKSNVDYPSATLLSLCSGVGMLDLGVEIALEHLGARPRVVGFVERDSFAAAVLLARMADQSLEPAPIWCGNLERFDWAAYSGLVDVLTAGFPCQPHSIAGKRAGTDDERWIWPAILDGIRLVRPRLVFLENVSGLRSSGGMDDVLRGLAESGFAIEWDSVRAGDVGASHQRERVFLLAYRPGERCREAWRDRGRSEIGAGGGGAVANASGARLPRCELSGEPSPAARQLERQRRAATELRCPSLANADCIKRQPGWTSPATERPDAGADRQLPLFAPGPDDHQWRDIIVHYPHLAPATEPAVHGLADGLAGMVDQSRSDRIRCAGNGVVPLQAAVAFVVLARRAGVMQ